MSDPEHGSDDHPSGDGPWRPGTHGDGHEGDDEGGGHEDEHGEGGGEHEDEGHEALETGGDIAKEVGELVGKAREGDALGAVEAGLGVTGEGAGAIAGALGENEEEAREALEALETVAELTKAGTEGVGHALGHGESHEDEAHERGQHRRHEALDRPETIGAEEIFGDSGISFHLEVSGVDVGWQVVRATTTEALQRPFTATVEARMERGYADEQELLGKQFVLSIERGASSQRNLRGVVRQCWMRELADGHACHLVLVPNLWLLGLGIDSRIFQDKTIPEVVSEVVQDALGDACTVNTDALTETYEQHEYIVQYQESTLAFVTRLLEQEGIFYAIDCETEERENLVLYDSTNNLPLAREHDDGRVSYRDEHGMEGGHEEEHAFELRHTEEVAPAAVTVGHYDWTNPSLELRHSRRGESRVDPPAEVYDHTDVVTLHQYSDPQYGANTAERASLVRHQLVMQSRHRWTLQARIVTARPGTMIRLEGSHHDDSYLIVRAESNGETREDSEGRWSNSLVLQPISLPYRPPVSTPRPVVPGPETAVVVGPSGEEIHTDEHGRVKVHFHWDRLEEPDSERSSCWMRVSQSWAGPGFGTFFLPRIGMEVVVSFLGGSPDRPLVTGCVYNGQNRAQFADGLPANKTQSYIRTKSSLNSDGFNELRFEDKAGDELIYTHAQKDYDEVVENNHSTHVKVDQSNTIDRNHTEMVHGQQELEVDEQRFKTVHQSEFITVDQNRTATIKGSEYLYVDNVRETGIKKDDRLQVDGHRTTEVGKKYTITSTDHYKVLQNETNELYIKDCVYVRTDGRIQLKAGQGEVTYDAKPSGTLKIWSKGEGLIRAENDKLLVQSGASVKVQADQKITLEAPTEITLLCGPSMVKLTPSGIEIAGPTVKVNATSGITEIDAQSQVKIKC